MSVFTAASVGLIGLPVVALGVVLALRLAGSGRQMLGLAFGAGVACVVVGLLNLDYRRCPDGYVEVLAGEEYSCGGFHPAIPLAIGGILVLVSVFGAGLPVGLGSRPRAGEGGTDRLD